MIETLTKRKILMGKVERIFPFTHYTKIWIVNKLLELTEDKVIISCKPLTEPSKYFVIYKSNLEPQVELWKSIYNDKDEEQITRLYGYSFKNGNLKINGNKEKNYCYTIENGKSKLVGEIETEVDAFEKCFIPVIWETLKEWQRNREKIPIDLIFSGAMWLFRDEGFSCNRKKLKELIRELTITDHQLRREETIFPDEVRKLKTFYRICKILISNAKFP